jgi:prephenate dehydrogenase
MTVLSPVSPLEDIIAIVGVGLIGGSLAAALKQRKQVRAVIGVGRNRQRLEATKEAGLIDEIEVDVSVAAKRANVVVVCTPVDRIVADVRAAASSMQPGALITDAGSTKGVICGELADLATGPVTFVGAHPLAGSEKQGFESASATLFEGRVCVLTPLPQTPVNQVERTRRLWQAVGMQTCQLSPEEHDAALAYTSHLPHAVAAALAAALPEEYRRLTSTGFRHTTRVAAGDPELWTAIFRQNSQSVLAALDALTHRLGLIRAAIIAGDEPSLKKLLQQAKTDRMALDASPASSAD